MCFREPCPLLTHDPADPYGSLKRPGRNTESLASMHPAEALWAHHHPPAGYPAGVVAVPVPISGLAFFPGGFGLWGATAGRPLPPLPLGGVMVLGHDFHSEAGYQASRRAGGERLTLPTWSNLLKVLAATGIPAERCFFTNLYMGLRAGTETTGPFPGVTDQLFVAHCRTFLIEQLRVQRPALVLSLGVHVPPVLGALSPELRSWAEGKGLRHLDAVGPVRVEVTFPGLEGYRTTVVALIHPSLRHASLRHRRYGSVVGADAELAMLRDGMTAAGMAVMNGVAL